MFFYSEQTEQIWSAVTASGGTVSTFIEANSSDPFFTNVSLLMKADGEDNSTAFIDNSNNNLAITPYGNTKISTTQSKFGGSSISFDGTGDYLSSPASPQLDFGTGDFTIECWFYVAGNSPLDNMNRRIAALTATYPSSGTITGMGLFIMGDSTATGTGILFANYVSGTSWYFDYAGAVAQGVWHHVAVSRQGALMRLFLNGTIVASGNINNQSITNPNALTIGRTVYSGYTYDFNGYIDDFRITKGVARYTENFTPPDAL